MTDPIPLSPAAQAALDAADEVFAHGGRIRDGFAAALRAAAIHIRSEEFETCGGSSYALMIEVDDLLAIAAELEGQ